MRTNPKFFWTIFAAAFVASMFIPVAEFHKPGGSSSTIYVGTFYHGAALSIGSGTDAIWWIVILMGILFHVGVVATLAMLTTGAYRFLSGQAFESTHVFSSPEPTRSEWDTFLAGHDDKPAVS